ncbi:MAG: alpha/beta fold hydrolase [Candidatus Acidiferrales bacterium]
MKSGRICVVALLVCLFAARLSSQSLSSFRGSSRPPDVGAAEAEPANPDAPSDESSILKAMSDKHGFTASPDGACLFYRYWMPAGDAQPKDVVLVLHGIGLHSGVYKSTAVRLNKAGIAVYALDTRGHGLSCGKRRNVPDPATETSDISSMLGTIRQKYPHAELFLMGESMGTIFALNYAKENPQDISGLILLSPVFGVNRKQYEQFKMWLYLPDLLFLRDRPDINLVGRGSSHDKQAVESVSTALPDPLVYDKISVNYILELRRNRAHWTAVAPMVRVPTLVMKGDLDSVGSQGSARKMFALLDTQDKEYDSYPNVQHSLLANAESPEIIDSLSGWIVRH